MLVQIDPIQQGDAASPNLWNARFGKVTAAVNGNIDTDNLKDRGVTREKIALDAVGSDELAEMSIKPSHMNNVWVGKSNAKLVTTSEYTAFNKTVTLQEASYVLVSYNAYGNANGTDTRLQVQLKVNDVDVYALQGYGAIELWAALRDNDYPFFLSGITEDKYSGNVNIKVVVKCLNSHTADLGKGFVKIEALGDNTYLG